MSECLNDLKYRADRGDLNSMVMYASLLELNNDNLNELQEATRYFKMAAKQGYPEGKYHYGVKLCQGQGVKRNYKKGCHYLRMALSDKPIMGAIYAYGVMLERGTGVPQDIAKACHCYQTAASRGYLCAKNNYAVALYKGLITKNLSEACSLFSDVADKGIVISMFNYAIMLKNGEGTLKNEEMACRYFKLASDKGNIYAMKEYAKMSERGIGVPKNQKEANHYYEMSNDQQNIDTTKRYQEQTFAQYVIPDLNIFEEDEESKENSNDESLSSSNEFPSYSFSIDDIDNYEEDNVDENNQVSRSAANFQCPKSKCHCRHAWCIATPFVLAFLLFLILYFVL